MSFNSIQRSSPGALRETKCGKIKLVSFGFKCGAPTANYYFDVSFAVNPAREERWGMFGQIDEEMTEFVLGQSDVRRFIDLVIPLIGHLARVDAYQIVAFGCNSGRHRSPIIVNEIAAKLVHEIPLEVEHRDLPEGEAFPCPLISYVAKDARDGYR
jgi:RNase adaptor protein for sRNA GlmZ degradation